MATNNSTVEITFKGDSKDLQRELKKMGATAEKQSKKATKGMEKFGQALKANSKLMRNTTLAVGALSAGVFFLTKKTAESMDAILAFSNSTGIAVDTLSRLSHVAEINKTSSDNLNKGMFRLIKSMGDADRGAKNQVEAFKEQMQAKMEELKKNAKITFTKK